MKNNKIQYYSILVLEKLERFNYLLVRILLKYFMWPNISFIITKGFKSTILEKENPAVNGGHIVKLFTWVSLKNHSNNSYLTLFWLEYYHISRTFSYFLDHSYRLMPCLCNHELPVLLSRIMTHKMVIQRIMLSANSCEAMQIMASYLVRKNLKSFWGSEAGPRPL